MARSYGLGVPAIAVIGVGLFAAALLATSLGLGLLGWLRTALPNGRLQGLVDQLQPYQRRPEVFRRSIGWGLAVQFLNVLVVIELGNAMRLGLPIGAYCLAVPAVAILTILPVSISGVGVREGALVWMLASYGVKQEMAITLGLLWFLVTVVSGMTGGIVYLCGVRSSDAEPTADDDPLSDGDSTDDDSDENSGENSEAFDETDAPTILSMNRSVPSSARCVSVVIPVFNEIENLDRLADSLCSALDPSGQPYDILLVDDGSTDGSTERIDELAAEYDSIKAIHLRRNYGQTAAMDAGIHAATGDVIVTLDADLQNDPRDIPGVVAKLDEGFDLVHGWRKEPARDALVSRRIPSRVANWLISRATGFPVHDLGCTLKAMRRETAQELNLYGEMHRFIPILAFWNGARCSEMVTRHHPRIAGKSKYGLSRTIRVLFDLVTVKYMIQYLSSPMKLFGMLGLAAGGIGMVAAAVTFGMWLDGFHLSRNPLLLLSIFAGFVAVQFFVLGLLGELGVRTYYESQDKRPYGIRRRENLERPRTAPASLHSPSRLRTSEIQL